MKPYKRNITTILSAILMAMTLVGLNTDQAIAQGKARKGAKGRASNNARIATATGSTKGTVKLKSNALDNNAATDDMSLARKKVNKANKKVTGAESFSIDIGTSENLGSQVGSARRKTNKHKR